MSYKAIKGTRDILPPESSGWQRIESVSRDIFKRFGYSEVRTPIMEETALFVRAVGEETDIVKKEMFSFVDRGDRDISLRPEGTAPIIRAYLENNLHKTAAFQKFYYIGPMFRAERPQAGRLRQFHQIGVEAIGSNSPALDAEVINLFVSLLDGLGIKNYRLRLNNLGCVDDKNRLSGMLKIRAAEDGVLDNLCEDCKRRAGTNPLRLLDCKNEECRKAIRGRFENLAFLCADCESHFKGALKYLDMAGVKYEIDPYIVRGLDYYTRTVFEVTHESLGAQNAIGAGGRYDNLIHDMGGPDTGACGFAIGIDRVLMLDTEVPVLCRQKIAVDVFVAAMGAPASEIAFRMAGDLRKAGIVCDLDYEGSSLKSQMRRADRLGARFVVIIGDDEINRGVVTLRDMQTKEQSDKKPAEAVSAIKVILTQGVPC